MDFMSKSHLVHNHSSVVNIGYHIIWCPKYRKRILVGDVEDRLKELLPAIAKSKKNPTSYIIFLETSWKLQDNKLTLSFGALKYSKIFRKTFKFSKHREIEGDIKSVTIKRTALGEYFVTFITDATAKPYAKSHNGASVGLDFGLKHYLTLSDKDMSFVEKIENPQFLKHSIDKLRKKSRTFSKCQKGSNNRKRALKDLNRLYEKISNQRNDFQWKLAHDLCKRFDVICIEDLSLQGMFRNKHWDAR